MIHHIVITHHFYQTGVWELTPSRMNTFFGRGAVAFFFMITAFLFWGRAIDQRGHIDSFRFYVSRLRRMVPMYAVSVGLLLVTVLALTHFRFVVPPVELGREVMAWLLFTIPGAPDVNALKSTYLINTVFWSLVYEWKFYLLFPALAIFARGAAQYVLAGAVAAYFAFFSDLNIEWFFLAGCAAAVLSRHHLVQRIATTWIASVVAVIFIAATIEWQPLTYSWIGATLLFVPFVLIASGNSMFGLLTLRPARLLGLLSYSIYLLHNWVLFLISRLVNHYTNVAALNQHTYWLIGAVVVICTVTLAAATYRFVEHPCMRSSKGRRPDAKHLAEVDVKRHA